MPCKCKELERRYRDDGCKCVHYREEFPDCECEEVSVSDYSPALVRDDELLIRTLYSPIQINQDTGWVDPAHFRNDAMKRGFSVNRKSHVSEADLRKRIESKIARDRGEGKKRDDFYGVVTARSRDIRRQISKHGKRLFCVYDTAVEEDVSHADICQALDLPPGTPDRRMLSKKISSLLFEAFVGEVKDLAAVYSRKEQAANPSAMNTSRKSGVEES